MRSGYISVDYKIQRSYLFAVVANVGPGGVSRTLSVAYRQHPEKYNAIGSGTRVEHMVADTLALIAILSDPANRAPLEAEKAIAEDWYRRSHEPPVNERPSVPDRPQPLYVPPSKRRLRVEPLPALPWQDEAVRTFPLTATCVLLALLRGNHRYWTRIGDVQFQPLSTVFRGDCKEYGLIVLDISDLSSGVKYGIAAFNIRYMAQLSWHSDTGGWDPVEDVHRPDHMSDDISARFHSHILKQWESDSNHTMKSKTIYSTSAFVTGLRSHEYLPSSPTINSSHNTSTPTVFPTIHLFMFDSMNGSSTGYTSYYCMENTILNAGDFATRFLGYLRALGPEMQPDKAILRFAYNWGLWLFPPIRDGSPHRPPRSIKTASSAADELGVRPIPLGFFDPEPDLNSPSSVRLGEVPRGSWVVLVDRRGPKSEWGEDKPFLQYSFVRIHSAPVEMAPKEGEQQPHQQHAEQQQQNQQKEEEEPLNSLQVVGGLTDFLRITVPDTDISTWETRLEVVEGDVSTASFETTPSSVSSSTHASVNTWVRRLLERSQQGEETDEHDEVVEQQRPEQELLEAQIGVEEVEMEGPCSKVRVMAESLALTLLGRLR
ncbi:hypothetical protein PENNAL_c0013G11725 [Penicillium nalgiovense]|uniref:Uncharacterized protein n=1 Tax=Penicillium nalgiovense TaxID=60175 RepID=A0A1V6YQT2_PENNA|nr:hypothetical protein PENNAL_c0013G11725 [Penicillium nalgiovense]